MWTLINNDDITTSGVCFRAVVRDGKGEEMLKDIFHVCLVRLYYKTTLFVCLFVYYQIYPSVLHVSS